MDDINPPTPDPVSPDVAAIDRYLADALRAPHMEPREAQAFAQQVIWMSEEGAGFPTSLDEEPARAGRERPGRFGAGIFGSHPMRRTMLWTGAVGAAFIAVLITRPNRPHVTGTTRTYTTTTGQQARVVLDDGTRVTLAPRTTLRLTNFGARSRSVAVDGEAYFQVARASGIPFLVHSGAVTTRVLGTAFLVRHYKNDLSARVVVDEGKVSVSTTLNDAASTVLTAGRIGDVTDSTIHVLNVDDGAPATSWMNGKLVFHDTPLADVLATLSRWYGYEFRVTDPALMQRHVTLGLTTRSSAAALANLEQILSVNSTVVGDTVTLTPHAVRPSPATKRFKSYEKWTATKEVGR